MNNIAEALSVLIANRDEFERIGELKDYEEQGYQSAPYLHQACGLSLTDMLARVIATQPEDQKPEDQKRDAGVIRWCNEQLAKENLQ